MYTEAAASRRKQAKTEDASDRATVKQIQNKVNGIGRDRLAGGGNYNARYAHMNGAREEHTPRLTWTFSTRFGGHADQSKVRVNRERKKGPTRTNTRRCTDARAQA